MPALEPQELRELVPPPGSVTLVTGPSGSGKSSLLRALRRASSRAAWIDLDRIKPREVPVVDCFDGVALDEALARLARVGLGEAWTYLRTPAELSDGQRWRLKLALALHHASQSQREAILCADEFGAVLDRVTAMVVARTLRNATRAPLGAIVATSHDDLVGALQPDVVLTCDFGRVLRTTRSTASTAPGPPPAPRA